MRRRLIFMLGILLLLATPAQPLFPVVFGAICLLGALLIANLLAKSLCVPLPAPRRAGPRSIGGRLRQYGLAGSLLALLAMGGYGVAMHLVHAEHVAAADQPSGPGGVIALAGGGGSPFSGSEAYSLALMGDGTVAGWGGNSSGQLGDGTTKQRALAMAVRRLPGGVVAIEAGAAHSLALGADGTVWAWGDNAYGALGQGGNSRTLPVQVSGLSDVTAIAAGSRHNLALKSDGTVWAWGYNGDGELGDGTTTNQSTPVQVNGLSSVIAIAGGAYHSLAVRSDGTVWAWGQNETGQLGVVASPGASPRSRLAGSAG